MLDDDRCWIRPWNYVSDFVALVEFLVYALFCSWQKRLDKNSFLSDVFMQGCCYRIICGMSIPNLIYKSDVFATYLKFILIQWFCPIFQITLDDLLSSLNAAVTLLS